MEVNVSDLRKQYDEFSKKLNEYDNIYLNIYNEINQATTYWKDTVASSFFTYCENRKNKIQLYINELDDISKIYQYIISKYSELGEKIKLNLNSRDTVINKINSVIYSFDDLITCYNGLDLSFCPYEASILNNQLSKLKTDKNEIVALRNEIDSIFDQIESIEREVAIRISKINVEIIQRINIEEYI